MPVFRRTKRWLVLLTILLMSSIFLTACNEPASILNTQGPVASDETYLFWVILVVASIVFVVVEGILLFAIFRYRERPGMPNPRQIHGNMKLELAWTAVPTVVLFIVLFFTIRGVLQVAPEAEPASANTVEVTAVGHQWWWEFHYDKYNITTADSLHVPVGTDIHVNLFSNNVIHSFWVPQLTGKTDVIPGHNNTKWFIANKVGTYIGECAEYCGTQHANMRFNVIVETPDQFQTWISAQQKAAVAPAPGSLAAQGQALFKQQCTTCHGIIGVDATKYVNTAVVCNDALPGSSPNNTTNCPLGPNLTHFGSRDLIAGGVLTNNKDQCNPNSPDLMQTCNLAKWLQDPQAVKPGNDMAIGQLSNDQIKSLVAYLESLQ
ncbi:MAG TPA: cytochrome c oxidase subunit II [Dictyobacter sp.]|jgi:cytochrome c oxidase subunit 2|nr:cytochrome c oxidase subunit II [Dictyobacter sp.]